MLESAWMRRHDRRTVVAAAGGLLAWSVALAVTTVARPGFVLELAVAGQVAIVLVVLASRARLTFPETLVVVAGCALPLLNTLPAQGLDTALARLGSVAPVALGVVSLSSAAALVAARSARRRRSRWLLAVAFTSAGAAVLSTLASDDRVPALTAALATVAVPLLLAAAASRVLRTVSAGWVVATGAVLASAVPLSAGLAAYLSSFGVPTSVGDLQAAEQELFRQFLFQEITFGNTLNLAALVLLLLPMAVVSAVHWRGSRLLRAASVAAAALLLAGLALTMSQGAMAVEVITLVALAAMLWRSTRRSALSVLAVALLLSALIVATSVATESGQPTAPPSTPTPPPGMPTPVTGVPLTESVAGSASFRSDALRSGWHVAVDHLPLGLGAEQYASADPVHQSPHSLALRVLAELGLLGGIALAMLTAYFAVALARALRRRSREARLLGIGASLAALSFLVHGAAFGTTLISATHNTWVGLVALFAALALVARDGKR